MYMQDPPNAIQVELTEGCCLHCSFCGIRGIRQKKGEDLKFMTLDRAETIAWQIRESGWNSRIEFAMHGEPTLNPNVMEIIGRFRQALPKHQLMMTSNGGGLVANSSGGPDALLEMGLNVLALDDYKHANFVPSILNRWADTHERTRGGFPIHWYPGEGPEWSPHARRPVSIRCIIVVQDITTSSTGTHSTLCNHTGCAFPPNAKGVGKRCAKPFRELAIRWNGGIALCCNDWRGLYFCGSVHSANIVNIWQNDHFMAARKLLLHGERCFAPCEGCDAISYRTGLLPDRYGQETLPAWQESDAVAMTEAHLLGPLTVPVKREWEK